MPKTEKEKNLQMKVLDFRINLLLLRLNEFQVLIEFDEKSNTTYMFEVSLTEFRWVFSKFPMLHFLFK